MIDDLRNLFGDMLTGKMKDSEIALTKQESALLRLKIEGLLDEGAKLRDERAAFVSRLEDQHLQLTEKKLLIADLTAKLKEHDWVPDELDQPTREVLQLLYDSGDGLNINAIRSPFGFSVSEAKFHLGVLISLRFIGFSEGTVGFAIDEDYYEGVPETYFVEQKGRAHIMKKG